MSSGSLTILDQHLDVLNIGDNFVVTGVSGMEPDSVMFGRPLGGCAILYRDILCACLHAKYA